MNTLAFAPHAQVNIFALGALVPHSADGLLLASNTFEALVTLVPLVHTFVCCVLLKKLSELFSAESLNFFLDSLNNGPVSLQIELATAVAFATGKPFVVYLGPTTLEAIQ